MNSDLPESLRALIAAERSAPVSDLATSSIVQAKLASSVSGAPLGSAAAGTALVTTGKVLAVLALAVGAGMLATRGESEAAISPRLAAAPVTSELTTANIDVRLTVVDEPSVPAIRLQPAREPSQTELLREAMSAMSAADASRALVLVHRDEQLHPRGALSEERAVLEIEALTALGRTHDATAARDRFIAAYPDSIHRSRIDGR